MVFCLSLYDSSLLLCQGYTKECAQAHRGRMLPLEVLAWETFWKSTLLHPGWYKERVEIKPRS